MNDYLSTYRESMVDVSSLLIEREDSVLRLSLNRPAEKNALNRDLADGLLAALQDARADPTVRAVVITGTGSSFCAGDDIAILRSALSGDIDYDKAAMSRGGDASYLRICEEIVRLPKPVVAGINGHSAGAGTEIASACDIRLLSSNARIGSALFRIGQVGNFAMMGRVLGPARATEVYLSGRLLNAEEALRIGLVSEVVNEGDFPVRLKELAAELASMPTRSVGLFKELRERVAFAPPELACRWQDEIHRRTMREIADAREGAQAFLDKRAPVFEGR